MSTFVNTVDVVGDEALTNSIIDHSITELSDNILTSIGSYKFYECSQLKTVNFKNVKEVGMCAFYYCRALEKADFSSCVTFKNNSFAACSAMTALILRNEAISTISGTPFAAGCTIKNGGTGFVYVPAALVDSYKAASGWSFVASQIRAIEDYPEICDPYTWDMVFKCIDDGIYASVYKVGDMVPLDLGSEGVVQMQIAGINVDDKADGSGKAPITWISKDLMKNTRRMNPALVDNGDGTYQEGTGGIGGWEKSELRSVLNNDIKALIPQKVSSRIVTVSKTHEACDASGSNVTQTTADKLWIPSVGEVRGQNSLYYPLFQNKDSNRIKRIEYSYGIRAWDWWLRDSAGSIDKFMRVISNGSPANWSESEDEKGVALSFCT